MCGNTSTTILTNVQVQIFHLVWDMRITYIAQGNMCLCGDINTHWCTARTPKLLFDSKTFKAKYFPHNSVHDCLPKPHHSWFWRSIITHKNSKLSEGRWIIGTSSEIPLNHTDWYHCQAQTLSQHNLTHGSVADLIDNSTHSWKPGLVRALSPPTYQCWNHEVTNF